MESFRVNRLQTQLISDLLQQVWYQTVANKFSYKPIQIKISYTSSKVKLLAPKVVRTFFLWGVYIFSKCTNALGREKRRKCCLCCHMLFVSCQAGSIFVSQWKPASTTPLLSFSSVQVYFSLILLQIMDLPGQLPDNIWQQHQNCCLLFSKWSPDAPHTFNSKSILTFHDLRDVKMNVSLWRRWNYDWSHKILITNDRLQRIYLIIIIYY